MVKRRNKDMGYFATIRNNIQDEMRIRGCNDKVQNILFLHKTDYNADVYAVKGNNGRLIGIAEVSEEGNIDIFL